MFEIIESLAANEKAFRSKRNGKHGEINLERPKNNCSEPTPQVQDANHE
jgi:hypothetical protein